MRRVLVTGASGFLGEGLVPALLAAGWRVRSAGRSAPPVAEGLEHVPTGDIALMRPADWTPLLSGIDAVIHLAGLAHAGGVDEARLRAVNTDATLALARAAAGQVRRFVFLSSIRAQIGPSAVEPLTEADPPLPTDAYGRAKLAAEAGLAGLDPAFVVLRPVLVLGDDAKGNLATLRRLAALPLPLPFAWLQTQRSVIGRGDLAAAIIMILSATLAPAVVIAAHPRPVTVAELIARVRRQMGRAPGLFAVPDRWLGAAAGFVGAGEAWQRLGGALVADPGRLIGLGWRPASPDDPFAGV